VEREMTSFSRDAQSSERSADRRLIRLLPYSAADGPHNMAADETLLESAVRGVASLRFYGWSSPTLSLGYFQPERSRLEDPRLAALPFVRRASGGDALIHHHEVTYALALPAGRPWQSRNAWPQRMHRIIAAALEGFGIPANLHPFSRDAKSSERSAPFTGIRCFQHFTPGDVLVNGAKVVGSAQRRQRGSILQHGGILLRASPYAPMLPGIAELTGRSLTAEEVCASVRHCFAQDTGWGIEAGDWTTVELARIEELAERKYSQDTWNRKR
jgi:lipoate-protein ligase A